MEQELTNEIEAQENINNDITTLKKIKQSDYVEKNEYYCDKLDFETNKLINDSNFIQLRHSARELSLFDIVGMTHTERWHSSFLAWLLNPNQNASHGLSYFAQKRFLTAMRKKAEMILDELKETSKSESCDATCKNKTDDKIKQYKNILNKLPPQEIIDTGWFDDCEIMPDCYSENYAKEKTVKLSKENSNKNEEIKCSLDISFTTDIKRYNSDKKTSKNNNAVHLLFICENKINSSEGKEQTNHYEEWSSSQANYPLQSGNKLYKDVSGKKYFALLFLSPDGKEPQNNKFLPLSYADIMTEVLIPCSRHPKLLPAGKRLLDEYMLALDRCNYAVRDINRYLAAEIIRDHKKTLCVLLKVLLFSELKLDTPEAKIAWLKHFVFVDNSISITLESDGMDCPLEVCSISQNSSKPIDAFMSYGFRKQNKKNCTKASNIDGNKIKVTINNNQYDLETYWRAYENYYYKTEKVSYVCNVCDKYKDTLKVLCNFLREGINEDSPDSLIEMTEQLAACLFSESKTWTDWNFLSETLQKIVKTDGDSEYIDVLFSEQKDGESSEVRMKIGKTPDFLVNKQLVIDFRNKQLKAKENYCNLKDGEFEEVKGLIATQIYAELYGKANKASSYQWSMFWQVQHGGKRTTFSDLKPQS